MKEIPNISNPKTYNEKINARKVRWRNELFVECSDKIAVREYVREVIGDKYLIEALYVGASINPDALREIISKHGRVLVKANHNSGPVQFAEPEMSFEELCCVCREIDKQLSVDFGFISGEGWYSGIDRQVVVEKNISEPGKELLDYKFHVFGQGENEKPVIIVHVDFERHNEHRRSYFDVDFNYIPLQVEFPAGKKALPKPDNYELMLDLVRKLAIPFSYVRVDLYNLNGNIYFGELTFAPGSGTSRFTPRERDLWMGSHWVGDFRF